MSERDGFSGQVGDREFDGDPVEMTEFRCDACDASSNHDAKLASREGRRCPYCGEGIICRVGE